MTTPTNWPNPERPGYPMFPENNGKHTLIDKNTGDEINAEWNSADDEWLMPGSWLSAKNAAKHFAYLRCDTAELTFTQITEMLRAERERIITEALPKLLVDLAELPDRTSPETAPDLLAATAQEIEQLLSDTIRNLGDAP